MINSDLVELDNCAKDLLNEIKEKKSSKSELITKFVHKYSTNLIESALSFLEDEEHIGSKKIENLEYYSRITGYYQKVSGWNAGKLQEFKDRKRYETISKSRI